MVPKSYAEKSLACDKPALNCLLSRQNVGRSDPSGKVLTVAGCVRQTRRMEISEFVEALDGEGRSLAAAAEEAGCDAKVTTCPGWQVRDLVRHTGMVHRWATAFVAEGHTAYQRDGGLPGLDGDGLLAWFREGHGRLVDTLAAAPSDLECWSFLPASSPLAFWARRQAHETTVHRVDAQSALGGTPSQLAPEFAVDGIDELLRGFHGRARSKVRARTPRVLRVRATDADVVWTVRLSAEAPVTERASGRDRDMIRTEGGDSAEDGEKKDGNGNGDPHAYGAAACEVSGPAAQLYLALWNRLPFPSVTGDGSLTALWRETSGVTWS